MKLFYKFLLNIKLWYICWCLHIKILNKPPHHNFTMSQACKNYVNWLDNFMRILDFYHKFSRGKTSDKWHFIYVIFSGQIWSNFTLKIHPIWICFADCYWGMSVNWINIYNLCYHTVVLEKIAETFKNCSFGTLFW